MKKIILMNSWYSKQSGQKSFHFEKKIKINVAIKTEFRKEAFRIWSVDEVSIWLQKGQKLGWNLKDKIDFNIKDWMHEILFSIKIVFEN